ncbi:MAG TPA: hypothetical protein VJT83_03265 [Chitinophagaceae bacterium]|nr:hypothetical protein [Chitinophagaceae bacterium]
MNRIIFFFLICSLAACSSSSDVKKLFILSSGKFKVDETQKSITQEPGNTHTEQEITYTDGGKVTVTVETPAGKKSFELPEAGSYVLNLKNDTLTGGIVNYGSGSRPTSMSNEQFDKMVDSSIQLIEGRNVSDEKKTYFIVPLAIKKISNSNSIRVVGPYKGIPYSVDVDKSTGKVPEVYKFFTNKQQRESVDELMKRMHK